jgi:hypothetical protein
MNNCLNRFKKQIISVQFHVSKIILALMEYVLAIRLALAQLHVHVHLVIPEHIVNMVCSEFRGTLVGSRAQS